MKIKHYSIFQGEMDTLNWETLRNDNVEKPYFLPYTKTEYLDKVDVVEPSEFATSILKVMHDNGISNMFSIGSGLASLEYQIKKFSNYNIVVSDLNTSILRLEQYKIFDNAIMLNAIEDFFPVDKTWLVLFPRIDTEFTDSELEKLFEKCFNYKVQYICFIPAELLNLNIVLAEIKIFIMSLLKRKRRVFCGYARSDDEFKRIWSPYYHIMYRNHMTGIFLEVNNND